MAVVKYFFLGIGGTGMSGLARLLRGRGQHVEGQDSVDGEAVRRLRAEGFAVRIGDGVLPPGTEHVVRSAAVPDTAPAVVEAMRRSIEVSKYADCLGKQMGTGGGIAVAGCHGKTTTTGMLVEILRAAGRDPSFVVGGRMLSCGTNGHAGNDPEFVVEACEFDRSFHSLRPRAAVVTNVDEDHLETYGDLAGVVEGFCEFLAPIPPDGVAVLPAADPHLDSLRRACACRVVVHDVVDAEEERGYARFRLAGRTIRLQVPGRHNLRNALAAGAVALALDVAPEAVAEGLSGFRGMGRRFERLLPEGDREVISDYAHHPAEVRAALSTARVVFGSRRLVVVFQPHQRRRVERMAAEFATALAASDRTWILPVYSAREIGRIQEDWLLAQRLAAAAGPTGEAVRRSEVGERVLAEVRSGDVLLCLGAGDIDEVARWLAMSLRS